MKLEEARKGVHHILADYPGAKLFFESLESDRRVERLHELANNFAINRLGFNDHGRTHAYIVAYYAARILKLLLEDGIKPNVVKENIGTVDDAFSIVTGAGFLHDIGNAVHREKHEIHSVILASNLLESYDADLVVKTGILEAIYSHESTPAVSMEASIVKIADGLDMERGRARIPYERGKFDIHAVSAMSIERVIVERGKERLLRIKVNMEHTAGLFQVENVLGTKIKSSALAGNVEVVLNIPSVGTKVLVF